MKVPFSCLLLLLDNLPQFPCLQAAATLWCCGVAISGNRDLRKASCVNLGQVTHFQIQTFLPAGAVVSKISFCLVAENGGNHKVWFQIRIQMVQILWRDFRHGALFCLFVCFILFCFGFTVLSSTNAKKPYN